MKVLVDMMAKHPQTFRNELVHYDIGKRRYIDITERCNLSCHFCPKADRRGDEQVELVSNEASLTSLIDNVCATGRCSEVVFSGLGEPTYRLYDILKAARYLKNRGVRVVLNTNGLADQIHQRMIAPDLEDNIDEINVSLNGHDAETYERLCRPRIHGAFPSVLQFLESAREYVPSVNIMCAEGIPGVRLDLLQELASGLGVGFRTTSASQPC